ncbi:MAG: phytanoyl-CoA dioxygenase family protein [Cyanobacteriota bacterium]|nr:phytanoyl-CoA dioxygenase family protein [Cyanobacteriota bacterium]
MANKTAKKKKAMEVPPTNYPWVDSPFFEILLEQSNLDAETKEIAKHFAENGYAIVEDLGIENIEKTADEIIEDLGARYGDKGKVEDYWIYEHRIQDGWRFNQNVKNVATAPNILSLLRTLYQREPIPFQTLNFRKGTQQSTHSDIIHFSSMPLRFMCGVWVALEDTDLNNGPLHYYPGSHKLPIFDLNDLGIAGSYQNKPYQVYPIYEEFLQSLIEAKGLKKHKLSIKKGQALIWAANLLHGGEPILDPKRSRHSQVTHYYFSDCMYHTPLLSDPFLHKIHFKTVRNIITGEIVPHIYNGETIEVRPEKYEIERLEYLLLKAETELEKVRPQLLESQDELSKLRPQLKAVEDELERLRPELYQYKGEAEELRPHRKILEEELERLRSQLYQSLAEVKELKSKEE